MRKSWILPLFGCVFAGLALAQTAPEALPVAAVHSKQNLAKEKRVRYLLRQVHLNEQQKSQAEGLIETFATENVAQAEQIDLEKVKELYKKLEEAQKAGDREGVQRISEELRTIGRGGGGDNEQELFQNIAAMLDAKQKTAFEAAHARLMRNPSGCVRPVDVFNIAKGLEPKPEQLAKLIELRDQFRAAINEGAKRTEEQDTEALNKLIGDVRGILTPEQGKALDAAIQGMRPDMV